MKQKAGNIKALEGLKYDSYKTLAKKTFKELAKTGAVTPFVIIKGEEANFKNGASKDQPFLYIGNMSGWKQYLTSIDKSLYSRGECRIIETKKGVEIELLVHKGKLAKKPTSIGLPHSLRGSKSSNTLT